MAQKNSGAKVTFANKPPNTGSLNILTVEQVNEGTPVVASSPAMGSESSWDGLMVPQDPKMQNLMGKSWYDITPSPFSVASPAFPIHTPVSSKVLQSDEGFKQALHEDLPSPAGKSPSGGSSDKDSISKKVESVLTDGISQDGSEGESNGATTTPPPQEINPPPQFFVANQELVGWLPFIPYDAEASQTEIPSAQAVGASDRKHGPKDPNTSKYFFGHLWSRLPTGCLQWLLNRFVPIKAEAFGAQLHFNRDGWFKGCLHVSVRVQKPSAITDALHKRVLFDHTGVWYAETPEQVQILDEYCRRLRALPQHARHQKLQSLPCNPMACEFAQNE